MKYVVVVLLICVCSVQAQIAGYALLYTIEIDEIARANSIPSTATDDITLEAWFKWNGDNFLNSSQIIVYNGEVGTNGYGIFIDVDNGNKISLQVNALQYNSGYSPIKGWWYHVAIVRNSGNWKLFVNGTQSGISTSIAPNTPGTSFNIGGSHSLIRGFRGVIDEIRLSESVRYTTNFSPYMGPFSSDANTALLYHLDESSGQTLIDSGPLGINGYLGSTTSPDNEDPQRTVSDAPLPVELYDFKADYQNSIVELSWFTAPLENPEIFELQRSLNGRDWQRIDFIYGDTNETNFSAMDDLCDCAVDTTELYYRLQYQDMDGQTSYSTIEMINIARPASFALHQNYPNPFNPATIIQYDVRETAHVTITIHNALGQLVSELVDEQLPAGQYAIVFSGLSLPDGIYFCKMISDKGYSETIKMVLVK